LVLEVISKAAEGAGVLVPIPIWAKAFVAVRITTLNKKIIRLIFILFFLGGGRV
jgi:hypothetical protein